MNAHTFPLPSTKEATAVASLPWTALIHHVMGGVWEPVTKSDGSPRVYNSPGLARAVAGPYKAETIFMGYGPVEPTVEQIRAVANPAPLPPMPAAAAVLDIHFPDGLYDGLDIVTAGRLNAERRADDDRAFDKQGGRW